MMDDTEFHLAPAEAYLGDGCYARFDGYMIILRAPRPDGDHWIGLEPEVLAEFEAFVARLKVGSP